MVEKDRGMRRYREEGRFSNAPDTKQQKDLPAREQTIYPYADAASAEW